MVVPPAPAPYRDPLFAALCERIDLQVIYQSSTQPSWDAAWSRDQPDPAVAPGPPGPPGQPNPDLGGHAYPARYLPSRQRSRPGRTPIVWPRGLERALSDADPDCVVVSEYGPASLRALAWCRARGRAYVVFTECTAQIDALLSAPQLRLHRLIARHADALIAVSSAARERLLSFGVAPERIAVALQSADLAPIRAAAVRRDAAAPDLHPAAAPDPHSPAPRPVVVLSVARLVPDKNLAALIEAFARSGLSADHATLQIAGRGFLEPSLRALAQQLAVPVSFLGTISAAELADVYAATDVFTLVSTYEPFGVAVREAAAAGLPLIVSRTAGAVGDVAIDGRNALLVDPSSVPEIAAALRSLTADAELRHRMGAESVAIDAATDGHDVDAFIAAVLAAARRRGRAAALTSA